MSYVTPLGENSEAFAWFSLDFAPFPFANFALYLFTLINHNHNYDYMLSPVSPSSESLNLRDGPVNHQHIPRPLS